MTKHKTPRKSPHKASPSKLRAKNPLVSPKAVRTAIQSADQDLLIPEQEDADEIVPITGYGQSLDFYHAMACYFSAGSQKPIDQHGYSLNLPYLSKGYKIPAQSICDVLRECASVGSLILDKHVSGRSLRIGATTAMASHPKCELAQVFAHGGWDNPGNNNGFI